MAIVVQGTQERAVRVGALVGEQSVAFVHIGAPGGKAAGGLKAAALQPDSPHIRQAFLQADLHHAQAGIVAVLGGERPVNERHFVNQFRAEALERA